jgi:two-component system response regulator MprA
MHVLVVDDEVLVRESLALALRAEGYTVSLAADGLDALEQVAAGRPDAVVLDIMMPRLDGLQTCQRLRAGGHTLPVMLLTAVDSTESRSRARMAGADEYLVKPFDFDDVLARLERLLDQPRPGARELHFADLTLHPDTRRLRRGTRTVELAVLECRILEALLRHPTHALSRPALFERMWGYDFGGDSRILDAYLGSLRAKLGLIGATGVLDATASGYALRVPIAERVPDA